MVKRILVIEYNEIIRENTAEILKLRGYEVLMATKGHDGFELTALYQPDVILCDLTMPEANGIQFLLLAKADPIISRIPLVLFSAGRPSSKIKEEFIRGADVYLSKPFTVNELLAAIDQAFSNQKQSSSNL